MSDFVSKRKKRILPIVLVSAALPLVLCVTGPLEVFSRNQSELAFSLMDFLPLCLALWALAALAAAAVLYLVPEKLYRVLFPVAAVTGFLLFLQSTYLNLGLSFLPGDNMGERTLSTGAVALNAAIWIVLEALAVASAFLKKRDIPNLGGLLLAVVVIGTQLSGTVFLFLSNDDLAVSKQEQLANGSDTYVAKDIVSDDLTQLAEKNNIVVFIVDRFDETFAEAAYYKEMPEVFDELTGFTWFQDNISMFGHTYPAIAWMLTQTPYSCEMYRLDYLRQAYQGETPLKRLHDAGYTVNVYTEDYDSFADAADLPDYFASLSPRMVDPSDVPLKDRMTTAGRMIQVALYRCAPLAFKSSFGDIDSSIDSAYLAATRPDDLYTLDMKEVYNKVAGEDFTLNGEKMFQFIHIEGCHNVRYNMDWEEPSSEEAGTTVTSVGTSFQIIDRYLQEMKRLGVYDDATILITGDHSSVLNDYVPLTGPRMTALFVKPAGSGEEPLKISMAQVSQQQLWGTILHSEGLDFADEYGESVFDVPEDEDQVRTYRWHTLTSRQDNSLDEYIYEIDGPSKVFFNWQIVEQNHFDKYLMD